MHNKSIYVIILNYNNLHDLKETISSFIEQDYPNIKLVVSDNSTIDESIKWLKRNYPEIAVLENGENLGWAEGNNVGIRYAIEQNADFILLANNDLSFDDKSIVSKLIQQVDGNNKLIIGPKQNYYYQPDKIFTIGHNFMNINSPIFNSFREKRSALNNLPDHLEIVDYVAGSFVLFHSSLIKDIGLIDSDFYLYGEDADFFLRSWEKGYISLIDKNTTILHKVSVTSGQHSLIKTYYQTRNIWLNLRKHTGLSNNTSYFKRKAFLSFIKNNIKLLIKFKIRFLYISILGFWHGAVVKKYGRYL